MSMSIHKKYMKAAIDLAKRGYGKTSPNPIVGAIVVKGGKIIGKGYHKKAGTPHAEVHALVAAGKKAKGATMYVNLEPCVHFGKTPPCVNAILESGIKKVVIGIKDPNPLVNGKGIKKLKQHGINVISKILEKECEEINKPYFFRIKNDRPMIITKTAITCDGKIAASDWSSRWISSSAARTIGHELRLASDAIMIGAETIRRDNPRLTVRIGKKEEFRKVIIISRKLNLPLDSALFPRPKDSLIIITTKEAKQSSIRTWEERGAKILVTNYKNDSIEWNAVLKKLYNDGCSQILVEGGGVLLSSLLKEGLIDRATFFIAPLLLGGEGKDLLPNVKVPTLNRAWQLEDMNIIQLKNEIVMEGRPCLRG